MRTLRLGPGQLQGENIATRGFGPFLMTETVYPNAWRIRRHAHELPLLCLVLRGSFEERVRRHDRFCHSGTLIARPGDETHSDRFGPKGARCLTIEIDPEWLEGWDGSRAEPWTSHVVPDAHLLDPAIRQVAAHSARHLLATMAAPDGEPEREADVLDLLAIVMRSRAERGVPAWMKRIREAIDRDFRSPWSLTAFAREAGVHPVHLARTFRRLQGCTLGEYVRHLRLEWARRQLAGTSRPIADVALSCGFADQSHFTRAFRAGYDMTPAAYRARSLRHAGRIESDARR
jgi:AraC family transcriptional regulator